MTKQMHVVGVLITFVSGVQSEVHLGPDCKYFTWKHNTQDQTLVFYEPTIVNRLVIPIPGNVLSWHIEKPGETELREMYKETQDAH